MPEETEVARSVPPPPAALLGILAVAGLLLWLFVLRDRGADRSGERVGAAGLDRARRPCCWPDAKVGCFVRLGVAVGSNRPAVQVPNAAGSTAPAYTEVTIVVGS